MKWPPYVLLGRDPAQWPDVSQTASDGILAIGGDLSPARLTHAYRRGIFPWYSEGLPILWHSPDPRFVLVPEKLHVPKSLEKQLKRGVYEIRYDTAFAQVLDGCAKTRRPGQRGTWITRDMRAAYVKLHELGFAHCAEAWADGQLMGGLYGVTIGRMFYGESMFARGPDASKCAFVTLVRHLTAHGVGLIDCQQETEHLARFGAEPWDRAKFVAEVARLVEIPTEPGTWPAR